MLTQILMKWSKQELYSLVERVGSGEEIQKPFAVMLFQQFLLSKLFFTISKFISPQIMTDLLLELTFSENLSITLTNSTLFERLYSFKFVYFCKYLHKELPESRSYFPL